MPSPAWDIWVDTGGTFTDAVAVAPSGEVRRTKVLSTSRLRARVGEVAAPGVLALEHTWGPWAVEPDAAAGWRLERVGDREHGGADVRSWRAGREAETGSWAGGRLPAVGDVVELVSEDEAPILAARLLTRTPARGELPPIRLRLATTRGTNALLTGAVAPTALFVNEGLADLLRIGTQQRPDLFALDIRRPAPLYERVLEVCGRLDARGHEVQALDFARLKRAAADAIRAGVRDAAVALLHSDLNPAHERAVAACLREAGFERVSCSSELSPFVKILPRATTALVNACLAPVIAEYLARVRAALTAPGSSLLVMSSAGGLSTAEAFAPKDSLLSGPAAGVIGAARAAAEAGFAHAVSFDMGGTSTDAARWARATGPELVYEHTVGSATLAAPAVGVETVAAGGGSICSFRDGALSVGPESAGASPGPACYGAGGPLTLTDVNLLLGRLCPERFAIPVDVGAAERALASVMQEAEQATGRPRARERLLEGFLDIAAERMAGAVSRASTRRGHDIADAVLVAFGGAGGQHACAVAARLGVRGALVPADAGVLSALGLGVAAVERMTERQVLAPLDEIGQQVAAWLEELGARACDEAGCAAGASGAAVRRRIAALRFVGQETTLEVDVPPGAPITGPALAELFAARYRVVYGYAPEQRPVELVWLRVVAAASAGGGGSAGAPLVQPVAPDSAERAASRRQPACFAGAWHEVLIMERASLAAGQRLEGPAIIAEDHATVVIEPGWTARVLEGGGLLLEPARELRTGVLPAVRAADTDDPAAIELYSARFESLAREMGEALARTSVSVNVKERLDFSCAVLDARGFLVACAPHVPVHLGSLGVCVRAVTAAVPLGTGDSAITNLPAHGGSHLPDVTVITPAFDDAGALLGYLASRAHHAEIGGIAPGSMPPGASSLAEEGVIIEPFKLVEGGAARFDRLEALLRGGPHPSRAVADNLADVRAALAANARGADVLRAMSRAEGTESVRAFMEAIQRRSERLLRASLGALPAGERIAADAMDDGAAVRVRLVIAGDELAVDFTGSATVHPGNLNATPAIVSSCLVYALRVLLAHAVPLNEGLLRPVRLVLPEGMLNPPFPPGADPRSLPAVVGGNVETSQRVVDVLLRALGLCAASQGTMNNLVFGPETGAAGPSYYETIGGGAGAGPGYAGASGVHTHMTNTRITDPEVLERRYPVRLARFGLRSGSGGPGRWQGGEGLVRVLRFLAPQRVSLLTQRRQLAPFGLEGGGAGARGEQTLARADGRVEELAGLASFVAQPGDVLTIRTPGGGGWGAEGVP